MQNVLETLGDGFDICLEERRRWPKRAGGCRWKIDIDPGWRRRLEPIRERHDPIEGGLVSFDPSDPIQGAPKLFADGRVYLLGNFCEPDGTRNDENRHVEVRERLGR